MLINSFFNKIPDIPDIPMLSDYTFDSIIDLPENIHIHDFRTKNIVKIIDDNKITKNNILNLTFLPYID